MPRSRLFIASGFAAFVALAALLSLSLVSATYSPTSALASPKGKAAASALGAASVPDCGLNFGVVASPNSGIGGNELLSISAISDNDVWAVGYSQGAYTQTLTEHWNGSAWAIIPSPNVAATNNFLQDVDALSSDDVWAVGYVGDRAHTLIEHWDGAAWSIVGSANRGTIRNELSSVTAISSTDAWAVGYYSNGSWARTITEHWDGRSWQMKESANYSNADDVLTGVTALASNDVWAVGYVWPDAPSPDVLTEHWNGHAWSLVAGNATGIPGSVSAVSHNDVWAVTSTEEYFPSQPGSMHWDGYTWHNIPMEDPGADLSSLNDVVALSTNDVWAVGYTHHFSAGKPNAAGSESAGNNTLIEHWDGSAWHIVSSGNAYSFDKLYGIAASSSTALWAVGSSLDTNYQTLIERYDPVPCPPTATPTVTATPAPPRCPGERFTDVCPGDYFYQHVLDLNDLGIVSGYNTAPPCEGDEYTPCFKPENSTTRGQIAKIVSLAAGFNEDVTGQTFTDVPPDSTFYRYIERMAARSIISGYPCGGVAEPCDSENRPYFRPGSTVSRGQLTKMTDLAFSFDDAVTGQTFADVLPASTFYTDTERLAQRGIIGGYPCGGAGEPCDAENRPYFRPGNNVTRGQIAKIVNLARIALLPTPTVTVTPEVTYTPTAIDTATVTSTSTSIDTSVPTTTDTPTTGPTDTPTVTSTPTP